MRNRQAIDKPRIIRLRHLLRRGLKLLLYFARKVKWLPTSIQIWVKCISSRLHLIVVHIQAVGLREHIEPVIAWLVNTKKCILVVVIPESQIDTFRKNTALSNAKLSFLLMSEESFSGLTCKPKIVFSQHTETPSRIAHRFGNSNTCRVVMQHGPCDKNAFHIKGEPLKNCLGDSDVVFLVGPTAREGSLLRYARIFPEDFHRLRFVEVGCPKTDALFYPKYSRSEFLSKMGLDPALPVVCYAPTHNKTASFEQHGMEIMKALASLDVNVIVKLHQVTRTYLSQELPKTDTWITNETVGKDWEETVQNLKQEYPNLKFAMGQDANPYLSVSDVLISDASGIAYEFLLLDRPIIFFDVPELFVEKGKEGIHYWGRECGDVVENVDDLLTSVKRALKDPNHKGIERRKMVERVFYSKGKATETAGQAILELAEQWSDMDYS